MVDRERVLARLDELDGYLRELRHVVPVSVEGYGKIETKRACERLLQISIEAVIDICGIMVAGLRLGLPAEEDDLFEKLEAAGVLSKETREVLRAMKGLRNILVHEYGRVDDQIVYGVLTERLEDFAAFKVEILQALEKHGRDQE